MMRVWEWAWLYRNLVHRSLPQALGMGEVAPYFIACITNQVVAWRCDIGHTTKQVLIFCTFKIQKKHLITAFARQSRFTLTDRL